MPKRWIKRPIGSNWGDFGENDQIGRLNLITPERRLAALGEVQQGIAFSLSLPLDIPGAGFHPPHRHPPQLSWPRGQNMKVGDIFGDPSAIDIVNDDLVTMALQYSTQWDSLAHIGAYFDADDDGVAEPLFYNGYAGDFTAHGVRSLGIENVAVTCVQGRGVLVDLFSAYGTSGTLVDYDGLMSVFEQQRVVVSSGDILCLYTGFGDAVMSAGKAPLAESVESSYCTLKGSDARLLQWITDSGLAAICADNGAVENKPEGHKSGTAHCAAGGTFLPLHQHCLFKLGIPLGELWYFKDLVERLREAGRNRFLLTAPPLRLPGAVGAPVMPVGTI
jgi:kynurenine formamidase